MPDPAPLKILHVFRAPLGGLFRHVVDLVSGQIARGHKVGIIADSTTGGTRGDTTLKGLAPDLALGLTRIPMRRQLGPSDIGAIRHVSRRIAETNPDVVHGHGAKGAAYARLAASRHPAIRAYTPHGGSLLYRPGTLGSRFYVMLEWIMRGRTDLFLFESAYGLDLYKRKVGEPGGIVRVVHNGIGKDDLSTIAPAADAADIVFIGELRSVKGVDVLLEAIGALKAEGLTLDAAIVGDGPDRLTLQAQANRLGLNQQVRFHGPMPAQQAFALGRVMVVPSRAESLPYIVLEAIGAGLPLITTAVGGIPEIFGPRSDRLIPSEDVEALKGAIKCAVNDPESTKRAGEEVRERVRTLFSVDGMVDQVLAGYRDALAAKRSA
ncbi:MAG: glycosyltransferase family 4 protein [Pseudorhodoplanes sp.]